MTSRKRLKGKARKEKAKAKGEVGFASLLQRLRNRQEVEDNSQCSCMHGFDLSFYLDENAAHEFLDTAIEAFTKSEKNFERTGQAVASAQEATDKKFPDLWQDPLVLEWAATGFTSMAVEALLARENKQQYYSACNLAFAEYIRQCCALDIYRIQPTIRLDKIKGLTNADVRRQVSYTKKRIPCNCLDSLYKQVRSQKKLGTCCSEKCKLRGKKIELTAMLSCGRCRRRHYCSFACQEADWAEHKDECNLWRKWEKLQALKSLDA
jgi:hypothetical protein